MSDLTRVIDDTWPAAAQSTVPGFTLRAGAGAGKRVSAATALPGWDEAGIAAAEDAMRDMGQRPLFMIREGEARLDALLDARGYGIVDPTLWRRAAIEAIDDRALPPVTAFTIWEPLAIMREIWATDGVGPERQAVMDRVSTPKTAIFGRIKDQPAGVAFAALSGTTVMVHCVVVSADLRRNGLAQWMMRQAARWGRSQGARDIDILVVRANDGANALYSSLGMAEVGGYHYRIHPKEAP